MSARVPMVTRWSGRKPRSMIATGQSAGRPVRHERARAGARAWPTPMSSTSVWSVPGGSAGISLVARDDGEAPRHAAVGDGDAGRRGHGDGARHAGHDLDRDAVRLAREPLLAAAPEHVGVAALEPHDPRPRCASSTRMRVDPVLRDRVVSRGLADVDDPHRRGQPGDDPPRCQPVEDHDVGRRRAARGRAW